MQPFTIIALDADAEGTMLPGLPTALRQGQYALSPALQALVRSVPKNELGDRFIGIEAAAIDSTALSWPGELVAYVGVTGNASGPDPASTIGGAELPASSPLVTVLAGLAAFGMLVPTATLISSVLQMNAVSRQRRLAVLHLVGATSGNLRVLAAVENLVIAVPGAVLGTALFYAVRPLAALIPIMGAPVSASDITPSTGVHTAVAAIVVVSSIMISQFTLRSPAPGINRFNEQSTRSSPSSHPLLLLAASCLVSVGSLTLASAGIGGIGTVVVLSCALSGVLLSMAWSGPAITALLGRSLRDRNGAVSLLAGSRLASEPVAGYRAIAGVVVALFVAAAFYGIEIGVASNPLKTGLPPGVFVVKGNEDAIEEAAVDRLSAVHGVSGLDTASFAVVQSKDDAATVWLGSPGLARRLLGLSGGTSGGAISRSSGLEPGGRYTFASGENLDVPSDVSIYDDPGYLVPDAIIVQARRLRIDRVVVSTDGKPATLDRIRTWIWTSASGAGATVTGQPGSLEAKAKARATVGFVIDLGLLGALLTAGLSLATSTIGGVVDRSVPFALLRITGFTLGELRRVVLVEIATPLAAAAATSMVLGTAASMAFMWVVGGYDYVPLLSPEAWLKLAAAVAAALAVAATALLPLDAVTRGDRTRFE